jgi:hypothetical protein
MNIDTPLNRDTTSFCLKSCLADWLTESYQSYAMISAK